MKALPSLGFTEAVKLASSRLTVWQGRSRRSEFWWWMLVVILADEFISLFITNLWVSTVVSAVIMFCGLAVTARRLQDSGKSAKWVYASYALSIIVSVLTASSSTVANILEKVQSGSMNQHAIQKIAENGMGELLCISAFSLATLAVSLVVIVMCLLDSDQNANKYGESPKYVEE